MGADALRGNGITQKLLYFLRDKKLTSPTEPLRSVRKSRILMFVGVQLLGFGATFALSERVCTVACSRYSLNIFPLPSLSGRGPVSRQSI